MFERGTEGTDRPDIAGRDGRNIVEAVRLLRNDHFDRKLAELKLRIAQPGLTQAEFERLAREQADLRLARQQALG